MSHTASLRNCELHSIRFIVKADGKERKDEFEDFRCRAGRQPPGTKNAA